MSLFNNQSNNITNLQSNQIYLDSDDNQILIGSSNLTTITVDTTNVRTVSLNNTSQNIDLVYCNTGSNNITDFTVQTSVNFSGSLSGDISGTQTNTQVDFVGTKSTSQIEQAVTDVSNASYTGDINQILKLDMNGDFICNEIHADLIGNASTSTLSSNTLNVGTKSAITVQNHIQIVEEADNFTTPGTLVIRDELGSFSGYEITANQFIGNLLGTASSSASTIDFSGSLSGDVSGTQTSTIVNSVGGKTSSAIYNSVTDTEQATDVNTALTIVRRDIDGAANFHSITGNVICDYLTVKPDGGLIEDCFFYVSTNGYAFRNNATAFLEFNYTDLNNLTRSILPLINGTYSLGSDDSKWLKLYTSQITDNGTSITLGNISSNLISLQGGANYSLGTSGARWNGLYTNSITDNGTDVLINGADFEWLNGDNDINFSASGSDTQMRFNENGLGQKSRFNITNYNKVNPSERYVSMKYNDDVSAGLCLLYNGNVGIGTTYPTYKLECNGSFRCTSLRSTNILDLNDVVTINTDITMNSDTVTINSDTILCEKQNVVSGGSYFNIIGTQNSWPLSIYRPNSEWNYNLMTFYSDVSTGEAEGGFGGNSRKQLSVGNDGSIYAHNPNANLGSVLWPFNKLYTSNVVDNGTTVLISNTQSLIPATTSLYDLGSASNKWAKFYSNSIYDNGSNVFITNGNLYPSASSTHDLGSSGLRFNKFYSSKFYDNGTNVFCETNMFPGTDNLFDIGALSLRWDDIYATNGTIQTSDEREKDDILDIDLGIDFINELKPKSYKWKGKKRKHYGLLAQDVKKSLGNKDFAGYIEENEEVDDLDKEKDPITNEYPKKNITHYGLRYNEFIAPMIMAIQELSKQNKDLINRIEKIENKNLD